MKILVTGADGQLGTCIKKKASKYNNIIWVFTDKIELDICNIEKLDNFFSIEKPNICINTAAYTQVDKAETESKLCDLINHKAVENLAKIATKHNVVLINVSTDYVFDGEKKDPYLENDICEPTSVYGKTKLLGEQTLKENCEKHINIRTSWLYSPYKVNFVKTMLKLFSERESLNVVSDQFGQPTNALDLAQAIIDICLYKNYNYGTYHFSNIGEISWFNFASKIAEISKSNCKISPIKTQDYPTPAKRPKYSTLDCSKITNDYQILLKNWEVALNEVMSDIKLQN